MKKEEVTTIAQLLTAMKDSVNKMEEAQRNNDAELLATAKREFLALQKRIDELL